MPPLNTFSRTCLSVAIGHALVSPVLAAKIEVTSTIDTPSESCTLREAVLSANLNTSVGKCASGTVGVDTIEFSAAVVSSGTIS